MTSKPISLAADHAGVDLKRAVGAFVAACGERVLDLGTDDAVPVDYPDLADALARNLTSGVSDRGILICGTGLGMSIAANRHAGIRAALVYDPDGARLARQHNDANVIVLAGRKSTRENALECIEAFLRTEFGGGRHRRRLDKLASIPAAPSPVRDEDGASLDRAAHDFFAATLDESDPELSRAIGGELARQQNRIELIASENIVSRAVLEAAGSVLTNKYAEGYPGRRYYGGCAFVDVAEELARERAKRLFSCRHVNVQPHSGAQANNAVYFALCKPGDTILGMSLAAGGHLTHGAPPSQSGKWFNAVRYGVRPDDARIDYDNVASLAREHRPRVIIAGGSAYPRIIDFARFREIADAVDAFLLVDMAHFAGLVAGGVHPDPLPFADIVTTTTHKTLRGPRGGMILTNDDAIARKIDSAVFPGVQGGPLMHVVAAKAAALGEALRPDFADYAAAVVANAKALASRIRAGGFDLVSGGTDTHLMLVDLRSKGLTGKRAEEALERAGITCNKNGVPFDPERPTVTSGIRLGSPAATTRGFGTGEFERVGESICRVLDSLSAAREDGAVEAEIRETVRELCAAFPIYTGQR